MSSALLRYHLRGNNFRAACSEAEEFGIESSASLRYVYMRMSGESRKMARMLALQRGPALRTDSEFRKGHVNGNQFESCAHVGLHHRRLAERAGVNTSGRIYVGGLARYPGDPSAWVSGRGDIQQIAEDRGWGVSGAVNVARREAEPMPDVRVGPDIVAAAAAKLKADDPKLSAGEARHEAAEVRSGASGGDSLLVSWPEGEGAEQSREIMP